MQKSDSIKNVMTALGQFQEAAVKIRKDAKNPWFKSKYASLSAILDEIQPILTKSKLAFTQLPIGSTQLETVLCHWESGEVITSLYDLNCVTSINSEWPKLVKEKDIPTDLIPKELSMPIVTPQALGSAITYARRYALTAILGLNIDDDDDGNAASGNKGPENPNPPQNNKQQPQANNNTQAPAQTKQPAQNNQQQPVQPQQNQQPQPAQTPFNKAYTEVNAIIAVVKSAAKVEELTSLYFANQEFVDKNQQVKDLIGTRRDLLKNNGKLIITNDQFNQVCNRIYKGDATVLANAMNAYILNHGQIEQLQTLDKERQELETALSIKYQNPDDIATMIKACRIEEHITRIHSNNAMIIDRTPDLMTKLNARLKALKAAK